jgi:hypothetical protein
MGDVGETDKDTKTTRIPLVFGGFEAGEIIAKRLMKAVHPDLCHVNIKFICRNIARKRNKKAVPGSVYKVNPMFVFLTEHQYIIEVALEVWNEFDPKQREALIDHLMTRIHVETDDAGEIKTSLRSPQVQEFPEIVERHQAWSDDLQELERHIR